MGITYFDRKTGQKLEEIVYGGQAVQFLYGATLSSRTFGALLRHIAARIPWISALVGYLQKRPSSAKRVAPFISEYGIDPSEFADNHFSSFNDFFIRKLKPECRPIVSDPKKLAMPADGRYLVFPDLSKVDGFFVKGQQFDLFRFLRDPIMARRYKEGSLVLARLCPTDYHRFHFPCDGTPSFPRLIPGPLYSVNPIALRKNFSILAENKRMVTEIDTPDFGHILYVEIGATCVGSIHQTYRPEHRVKKGEEKGYFSFGGSCLALLFEKGRIAFDLDLIENSKQNIETKANFGESLGTLSR